jgi:tryptophanyl-tRNA synthetase
MLTSRLGGFGDIETNIRENVLGNLAVGIDPNKTTIYLQSQVPQTAELFLYFSMLVTVPRAQRIPTLKDKLRSWGSRDPRTAFLGIRSCRRRTSSS